MISPHEPVAAGCRGAPPSGLRRLFEGKPEDSVLLSMVPFFPVSSSAVGDSSGVWEGLALRSLTLAGHQADGNQSASVR